MAVETIDARHLQTIADTASGTNNLPNEQFITAQLQRTGRRVKLVDVASQLMNLAAAVFCALFALILLDHWVVDLGVWGRSLGLVGLVGGITVYVSVRLLRPLLGRINPVYAAQTIERTEPSFKNSLISFLFFRDHRSETREVMYHAMEQQAAADLSRVDVDAVVDWSKAIRIGYVLAGILAVCGLYTVFSPKDPLQTVARIAAPWKSIARPSRVQISDVRPGHVDVYHGRSVEVSATVRSRGLDSRIPVTLVCSTADGRVHDRRIAMEVPNGAFRYQYTLPEGTSGVEQDIIYRLEAGDAVTEDFRITVLPAPSIVVDRVEYEFPTYTGRSSVVREHGDIRGLEGTRVTVHARANENIKSGYLQFDAATTARSSPFEAASEESPASTVSQTIPLSVSGRETQVRFTLRLRPDRQAPWHSNYQLRFVTEDGVKNQEPVLNQIDVTPDLPPVVDILRPRQYELDVPADGRELIEVRALDPDFALAAVSLRGVSAGRDLVNESLLSQPQAGQVTLRYDFVPQQLGLAEGDVVVCWAVAEDNRTSSVGGQPEPNTSRTANYRFRIVAPTGRDQDSPEQPDQGTPSRGEGAASQGQEGSDGSADRRDENDGDQSPQASDDSREDAGDQNQPGTGEQQEDSGTGPQPEDQSASGQNGEAGTEQAESTGGDGDHEPTRRDGEGDPQSGSQPSQGGQPQSPERGDQQEAADQEPLPSDGSRDGEALERILQRMREQKTDASREEDATGSSRQQQEDTDSQGTAAQNDASSDTQEDSPDRRRESPSGASPQSDGGSESIDSQAEPLESQQERSADDETNRDQTTPGGSADQTGHPPESPTASDSEASPSAGENNRLRPEQSLDGQDETGRDRSPQSRDAADGQTAEKPRQSPEDASDESQPAPTQRGSGGTDSQPDPADARGPADENSGDQSLNTDGSPDAAKPEAEGGKSDSNGKSESVKQDGNEAGQPQQEQSESDSDAGATQPGSGQPDGSPREGPMDGAPTDSETPTGGSDAGAGESSGAPTEQNASADDPNLEHARKATDLALEYLEHQSDSPDDKLLDRLGWSEEDLRKFIDRWQRMKRDAAKQGSEGQQAQRELDGALRSLGLRAGPERVRQAQNQTDQLRGMRESGRRSNPPAEYREQFEAYLRSITRGDQPQQDR